jgi:hypothetical protein
VSENGHAFSVGNGPVLDYLGCLSDERKIQMSQTTHHMSCMDPYKIDADAFQQIQSIGSMEEAKKCL